MFIKIYDEIPEEAKTIREAVFIKEQGFKDEFDEIDDVAKHVLLFEGDIPVGTCRFFFSEERNCYVIGRIAVRKEFRGKRYGEKMLQGAEKAVRDLGGEVVELSAQCRVTDFYNKQGKKKGLIDILKNTQLSFEYIAMILNLSIIHI